VKVFQQKLHLTDEKSSIPISYRTLPGNILCNAVCGNGLLWFYGPYET